MKSYAEFIAESAISQNKENLTIEELSDVCRKIVKELSKKIGIPFGLIQQSVVLRSNPYPHIHCKYQEIVNGLEEDNEFLADECCQVCAKLAAEYGLEVHIAKEDDEIGNPGDIIAFANIK